MILVQKGLVWYRITIREKGIMVRTALRKKVINQPSTALYSSY